MQIHPGNTYIGTLRTTGRWHDPLALRNRLDRMLSAADLQPPGLPRHAILCIRMLRGPLPQWWRTSAGSIRPPQSWERALATTLDQLVRRAAHPGRGGVPDNAEAVVFADYAELLACLANDWCKGEATTHWWWQSILRGQDVAHAVRRAWREAPEYIPAALQLLARRGRVVSFARALPASDAYATVQSITHRFALSEFQAVMDMGHQTQHERGGAVPLTNRPPQFAPQSAGHIAMPAPPWQSWVPESMNPALRFEQQCLLGLGLMLQRASGVVRTPSFALAMRRWSQVARRHDEDKARQMTTGWVTTEEAGRELPAQDVGNLSSADSAADSAFPEMDGAGVGTRLSAEKPQEQVYIPSPLAGEGQDGGEPQRGAQPVEPPYTPASTEGEETAIEAAVSSDLAPMDQVGQPPSASASAPKPPFADAVDIAPTLSSSQTSGALDSPDLQIDTDLGGLFYLINVGLFLNLYGDFTTPAQPGIALPVWDFVTLLGQKLVGKEMHADPVWGLLAHLSGRGEQVAPGADFEPPDIWRIPVEWLGPFPEDEIWHWQAVDGRLRLRHPAQFLVLDVPLLPVNPELQLRSALQDYGMQHAVELPPEPPAIDGSTAPLERWLGWLLPYVRTRLQRALQMPDADELAQILCVHRARVVVTATHVDIVLALDTLPIEIRLAGLDRNPGWVPAAGRFIAFHFE